MKVIIYTDGASRGNPGRSAIGAVIADEKGNTLATISKRIGRATNNQAEYRAVIAALEKAVKVGAKNADIRMDSELVVKQLNGRYRVRNMSLKPLYDKATGLLASLERYRISHIPRSRNAEADRLANRALDESYK